MLNQLIEARDDSHNAKKKNLTIEDLTIIHHKPFEMIQIFGRLHSIVTSRDDT